MSWLPRFVSNFIFESFTLCQEYFRFGDLIWKEEGIIPKGGNTSTDLDTLQNEVNYTDGWTKSDRSSAKVSNYLFKLFIAWAISYRSLHWFWSGNPVMRLISSRGIAHKFSLKLFIPLIWNFWSLLSLGPLWIRRQNHTLISLFGA